MFEMRSSTSRDKAVRFTATKSMGDEANLGDEIHDNLETDEVDSNTDKAVREGERKIRVGALLELTNYVRSPPTKKFQFGVL
jgi:hypothetical protein